MSQERLQKLAEQLEQQTGKLCVYKALSDANARDILTEYRACAREMGLDPDVIEIHQIEDYAFVLSPQEVEDWEWSGEGYEDGE